MSSTLHTRDLIPDKTEAEYDTDNGDAGTDTITSAADVFGKEAQSGLHIKRGQDALRLDIPEAKFTPPISHVCSENKTQEPAGVRKAILNKGWKSSIAVPGLSWIPNNLKISRLRSVLRCAIGAWISVLLVLIPRTQLLLGKSGFLILAATFLSPPCDPFIAVLEREIVLQMIVAGAYAWGCLGVWLAYLARTEVNFSATQEDVLDGRYIEAAPNVICAVFLSLGTSILLYLRTRMGQGKSVIATMILSCTAMDSTLTIAPLYPYPNYSTGKNIVIPIAFHSAIAIFVSFAVFPESVHGQFRRRFHEVFTPLSQALRSQPGLLCMGTTMDHVPETFHAELALFHSRIRTAESALGGLRAVRRLMRRDIAYGRFGADDFKRVHELARRMTVRAHGIAFYFKIMDPSRHRFPGIRTPGNFSPLQRTPVQSPPGSPPPTPGGHTAHLASASGAYNAGSRSPTNSIASRRRRNGRRAGHAHMYSPLHNLFQHLPLHVRFHGHGNHHGGTSLFAPSLDPHGHNHASEAGVVGVFESQAYLDLEARFAHPGADALRARAMNLLGADAGAGALLRCAADALEMCGQWVERVDEDRLMGRIVKRLRRRFDFGRLSKRWRVRDDVVLEVDEAKSRLQTCLEEFRREKRHLVLSMYRPTIDPDYPGTPSGEDPPPHRYLFQCYLYQYHLIQLVNDLTELMDEILRLECTRQTRRLWLPIQPFKKLFSWSHWEAGNDQDELVDDEDPDIISGLELNAQGPFPLGGRRDPDALPPRNSLEAIGRAVYLAFSALGRGNCVFAFKAGLMTALLSLPAFLPTSASWALDHRYVWALVPGQTTMSRFRGDTVFGLISRILSTFFGGLTGLAMWYISSGRGTGNPYGLAAVTAVCFPIFFFARIYYPGPPINVAFFFLTSQLVIGYSWQDTHLPSIGDVGWGLRVAWERFMLVTIGVFVAFVFSFLPPSTTLRKYLRITYATTASQLGQLYCDVLSFASVRDRAKTEEIAESLVAVRMKLNRSAALRKNVAYEVSLQGRWPAERYKRVLEIQLEMAYLLSHLRSVEEHLEPQWARAFLRRTRFMEPEFQGDILSVFCMVSIALRTGAPLPQITPCPLLDRFVAQQRPELNPQYTSFHGHGRSDSQSGSATADEYGLPKSLTIDILEDEQYLYFSVGVATAFGIITRLDRLMHATKELVGEQYHIHSVVDLLSHKRNDEKLYL